MKRILFSIVCISLIFAAFAKADVSDKNAQLIQAAKDGNLPAVHRDSNGITSRPAKTYRNHPVNKLLGADPTVVRYEGNYYLYPTSTKGYRVYVSDDLVHWEEKPKAFDDPRGGTWAPDVFHYKRGNGKLYLYYTDNGPPGPDGKQSKQVGVAVADHPLGPFVDKKVLIPDAIDAHLFQDDNSDMYLYYVRCGGIYVQPMANPLTLKGQPKLVIQATDEWEKRGMAITEGPWMLKRRGVYYLMYSGAYTATPDYAVGYATARSPLGPFTKYSGNPIAKRGGNVLGPGHHCVVEGPDGRLWMVYHQKVSTNISFDRFIAIDPLWFDDQGVIHVKTTRGTDEPVP